MYFAVLQRLYCLGIFLLCTLCAPATISAQQSVSFERIDLEAEPRTMYINVIIQDSRGIFWLGTGGGLVKYDGYSFTTYSHDPEDPHSISDDTVTALMEDSEGTLWVGTNDGRISMFDRMSGSFTKYSVLSAEREDSERTTVLCFLEDRNNQIWIGTFNDGLKRFDKTTGHIVNYYIDSESLPVRNKNIVRSLYKTSDNRLLVGTLTKGLWEFDPEKETFTFLRHMPGSEKDYDVIGIYSYWESMSINVILEDSSGGLWLGSDNGLFYSEDNDGNFIQFEQNPNDPYSFRGRGIAGIVEDHNGNIWIATSDSGLSRYDKDLKRFEQFRSDSSSESLSNDNLTALYRDRLGSIWIGVSGFGLHKYSPLKHNFPYYTRKPNNPNSLSDSKVYSIFEDKNGTVWIGTLIGGLNSLDRRTNTFTQINTEPDQNNRLRNGSIMSLCEDDDGMLLVGTVLGLDKLDPTTGLIIHFENDLSISKPLPRSQVRPIYKDRDGTIWLGILNQGLYRYIREEGRFIGYLHIPDDPTSISSNTIKSIYQSKSGFLWIGTEGGGLNKFDSKTEEFATYTHSADDPDSLSDSWIYCIHEEIDGSLWLGTRKGINHFDPKTGKSVSFSTEDGLIDNVVYGILPESDHLLWMSTNKGLSRFNTRDKTFENFDHGYGLQNEEFNTGAYFKNSKGEMFFGGQKGFHIFRPEKIVRNEIPPPIIITSFKVFNQELLLEGSLAELQESELPYDQNYVSMEFAALDYIDPAENRYAYKLDGVDREWVDSGTRRFVNYASLSPGNYTFRVKGANSHGVWNEDGVSLSFVVLHPYWDTWWFKSLLVLGAVSAIFVIFRMRINRLKKREQDLENEVALRTKELRYQTEQLEEKTEELEAFSYSVSHDLRNPLWQINLFSKLVVESPTSKLDEESNKHMDLIRQSCTRSLSIVNNLLKLSLVTDGELTLEMVNLSKLASTVTEVMVRAQPDRKIEINIQDDVTAKCDEGLVRLLLENLFENAIKYSAGREESRIAFESDLIEGERQFRISDNGSGISTGSNDKIFNAFQRGSDHIGVDGHGIGLNICKRIVRRHGGRIWVESKVDIGTTFFFTLS